jgi:hypothetical protein
MQTARRRRTTWAIAASVLAHAAVLAAALLYRPHLVSPIELARGPAEPVIPVFLTPRSHLAQTQARLPAAAPFSRPEAAPMPAQTAAAGAPPIPRPSGTPGPPAAGAGSEAEGLPGPDIRAALRHGATGCANLASTAITRAEREHCDEQLAAGGKTAPVLAEGRDPRIQAYFDAVAKAKAPDKPWTPIGKGIGKSGQEDLRYVDQRASNDHVPMFGCAIPFGPGEKKKLPAHWLKLGPCFIVPPKGPLTEEVDITPPDQDLSHPVEHGRPRPQRPPGVFRTTTEANDSPTSVSASAAALGAPAPAKDAEDRSPHL